MTALLDLKTWNKPDAFVLEKRYPVEAAPSLDPVFWDIFDYVSWMEGDVCWDVLYRMAPEMLFNVIATSAHDPAGWIIEKYAVHDLDNAHDYTGITLGEFPNATYAEHLKSAYSEGQEQPRFSAVSWSPAGEPRRYFRGIVPYQPGKLLVFTRLQPFGIGTQLVPHFGPRDCGDMEFGRASRDREVVGGEAGPHVPITVGRKWKARFGKVLQDVSAVEIAQWVVERYSAD